MKTILLILMIMLVTFSMSVSASVVTYYDLGGKVEISGIGPYDNATVTLRDNSGSFLNTTYTDSAGYYAFNNLAGSAWYNVTVSNVASFNAKSNKFALISSDKTDANFVFGPAASVKINGTIDDTSSNLLSAVSVKAFIGGGVMDSDSTDGSGDYGLTVIDGNNYDIELSKAGYITQTHSVTASGSDITLDATLIACDNDGDTYDSALCGGTDCNDNDATVYPGFVETSCNNVDDNCDGSIDEGLTTTYYADSDSDTYGDSGTTSTACSAPAGYVSDNTDCDDTKSSIYPGAAEILNSKDDDCDGSVDENLTCVEDWDCGSWKDCIDGKEKRTCEDKNSCGTTKDMPIIKRDCSSGGHSSSGGGSGIISRCGDGSCSGFESCERCPQDCGECKKESNTGSEANTEETAPKDTSNGNTLTDQATEPSVKNVPPDPEPKENMEDITGAAIGSDGKGLTYLQIGAIIMVIAAALGGYLFYFIRKTKN